MIGMLYWQPICIYYPSTGSFYLNVKVLNLFQSSQICQRADFNHDILQKQHMWQPPIHSDRIYVCSQRTMINKRFLFTFAQIYQVKHWLFDTIWKSEPLNWQPYFKSNEINWINPFSADSIWRIFAISKSDRYCYSPLFFDVQSVLIK